jgi:hypothetical protein
VSGPTASTSIGMTSATATSGSPPSNAADENRISVSSTVMIPPPIIAETSGITASIRSAVPTTVDHDRQVDRHAEDVRRLDLRVRTEARDPAGDGRTEQPAVFRCWRIVM